MHLHIIMSAIHQTVSHTHFPPACKDEINPFNIFITPLVLDLNPVDLTAILVLILQSVLPVELFFHFKYIVKGSVGVTFLNM